MQRWRVIQIKLLWKAFAAEEVTGRAQEGSCCSSNVHTRLQQRVNQSRVKMSDFTAETNTFTAWYEHSCAGDHLFYDSSSWTLLRIKRQRQIKAWTGPLDCLWCWSSFNKTTWQIIHLLFIKKNQRCSPQTWELHLALLSLTHRVLLLLYRNLSRGSGAVLGAQLQFNRSQRITERGLQNGNGFNVTVSVRHLHVHPGSSCCGSNTV